MLEITQGSEKQTSFFSRKRLFFMLSLLVILLLAWWIMGGSGGGEKEGHSKKKNPVPIIISLATEKTMPLQLQAIGHTESKATVAVKSLVDGQVSSIYFNAGDFVQAGKLLFVIDPRPLHETWRQAKAIVVKDTAQMSQYESILSKDQAQVAVTEANLKKDMAQLEYAKAEEARYLALYKKEYISREQYEQMLTNKNSLEGTLQADQAAINNAKQQVQSDYAAIENARANVQADHASEKGAKIRLDYAYIKAPFTGKTSSLLVHLGDSIKNTDTSLVMLDKISPINVTFSIPEDQLASIRKYQAAGTLKVEVETPDAPGKPLEGKLTFVDNTVDTTTGTIRLKALFENKDQRLWPGQFVNVVMTLANIPKAIVIPSQALQIGQDGDYIFVEKGNIADYRSVKVGRSIGGLTVVEEGLKPGEHVVIDGQLKLEPKAKVMIKKIQ